MCDVYLGKLGYGTVSECMTHSTPIIYVPRSSWAEERYLEVYLQSMNGGVRMTVDDFISGNWLSYLELALTIKPTYISRNDITNDTSIVSLLFADNRLQNLLLDVN